MDEFRAGVTAVLRTWSALRTAVENGWGGDDSVQKAEDLRRNICDYHFNGQSVPPKSMPDVTDLEDALAIYMEEEFSLTLEDNSEREIASMIWQMYEHCAKGDFQLALQMVHSADQIVASVKAAYPVVQVQSPEHDDEDDDDDDIEDDADEDAMMVTTNAKGQCADEAAPPPERATTTTTTTTTPPASLAEYAARPLFGPVSRQHKKSATLLQPVRQLGEPPFDVTSTMAPDVDDDGFAPVKRKGKPSREQC
jgi:pre-rRNA-processing protein TSR2